MTPLRLVRLPVLLLIAADAGCSSVVTIDVSVGRVCLARPGPTIPPLPQSIDGAVFAWDGGLPALPGSADGGVPATPVFEWVAEMQFNKVLAQLPTTGTSISADVRLASVTLSSTTNLDFIESIEVSISHGPTDAGSTGLASQSSGADGGLALACRSAGFTLPVASYHGVAGRAAVDSIDVTILNPDLNLFDCVKDQPTLFDVRLAPHLGSAPAAAAPLTLETCLGGSTHVSYP